MSTKQFLKRLVLRLSTILLPISLGLLIVALTLAMLVDFRFPRFTVSVFSICCALILWYAATIFKNRLRFHFSAILLLLTGMLLLLIDVGLVILPLPGVWPFLMLFVGISFLVSGSIWYRKAAAVYVVPAIAFAGLGILFLLFSTDIIPLSLVSVALVWFPLLVLPVIISVIIWLSRKAGETRTVNER